MTANMQYLTFCIWVALLKRLSTFIDCPENLINSVFVFNWMKFHCIFAVRFHHSFASWWTTDSTLLLCESNSNYHDVLCRRTEILWVGAQKWHRWVQLGHLAVLDVVLGEKSALAVICLLPSLSFYKQKILIQSKNENIESEWGLLRSLGYCLELQLRSKRNWSCCLRD